MPNYRIRFTYDPDASFEECNGEPRPLTELEYAANAYRACPRHPRAGSRTIDATTTPPLVGCAICGETEYADIEYAEYRAYYGNPDRHVYVVADLQRQCDCCQVWSTVGSTGSIDLMDDAEELRQLDQWYTPDQIASLPGYLAEVARADLAEFTKTDR